jgi:hypothetical protein
MKTHAIPRVGVVTCCGKQKNQAVVANAAREGSAESSAHQSARE